MSATAVEPAEDLAARVDALYEFEREPVTEDRLESARHFAAVFAGEHVAGTEFVIGAVFVTWGVGAADLLWGLLVGNLLAVLSWTLICAPIAVDTRLTLYWYLRRIAGPGVTAVYNVLNAVLFCVLAGTMITVSASAIRIPFGIPSQTNWYPEDLRFILVVAGVGAVVVTVAILGFRRLAQFSEICVPWIFVMFFAGATAMLPTLAAGTPGVETLGGGGDFWTLGNLWTIAEETIWVADPDSEVGFWHVVSFAWICNLAFHVGLSDMAVLRYAPRASYGLLTACGMYLGHFLAWICAGAMGAAAAILLRTPLVELDAGEVAYQSLGFSGALAVIIAGWATSNPTLYRAGLALQAVTPGWPRWLVTLIAGALTTAIACFPFVFGYLLSFVGLFGLLLMPVGAVVFVEHWVLPRLGMRRYWATDRGAWVNWPALVCWAGSVAIALAVWWRGGVHLFFLAAPVWLAVAVSYVALARLAGAARETAGAPDGSPEEPPPSPPAAAKLAETKAAEEEARRPISVRVAGWVALATLLAAIALPVWAAAGSVEETDRTLVFQRWLAWVSVLHLASLTYWVLGPKHNPAEEDERGSQAIGGSP